jgi:hypothetical protein
VWESSLPGAWPAVTKVSTSGATPAKAIGEAADPPIPEGVFIRATRAEDGKFVMLKPEIDPSLKGELDRVLDAVSGGMNGFPTKT